MNRANSGKNDDRDGRQRRDDNVRPEATMPIRDSPQVRRQLQQSPGRMKSKRIEEPLSGLPGNEKRHNSQHYRAREASQDAYLARPEREL